jgi:hypothetical protein
LQKMNIRVIKGLLFCLLNTNKVTVGFQNIIPQRVPLGVRVNAFGVVRHNFQGPMHILWGIIHRKP